jgi:hypothetical protein
MELFEKVIDGYKKEFNVIVNDEPLKLKEGEKAANPLAQMMAAQEAEVAANETQERSAVKELADVEASAQPATQTV